MKIGSWARLLLVAAPVLTGCKGFWDAPSSSGSTSFTLTNSGNITVAPGATSGNTSTITVTPASSFTGTVSLDCSVTSAPSGATNAATCSLSPTSLAFSSFDGANIDARCDNHLLNDRRSLPDDGNRNFGQCFRTRQTFAPR